MSVPLTFARVNQVKAKLKGEDWYVVHELQQLTRELAYELWNSCFNLDDEFTAGEGEEEIRALLRKAKKATTPPKRKA